MINDDKKKKEQIDQDERQAISGMHAEMAFCGRLCSTAVWEESKEETNKDNE